jgi:hypothetical protein
MCGSLLAREVEPDLLGQLIFALMAVYLVDVIRNPDLLDKQDMRTMWIVLVIILNGFAMPVYWWLYLRPGSESFHRRRTARQNA